MRTEDILKTLKKYQKYFQTNRTTLSNYIKDFEMNVQFNIQNNIYNSFMTIHQMDDLRSGDRFKMIRQYTIGDDYDDEEGEDQEDNNEQIIHIDKKNIIDLFKNPKQPKASKKNNAHHDIEITYEIEHGDDSSSDGYSSEDEKTPKVNKKNIKNNANNNKKNKKNMKKLKEKILQSLPNKKFNHKKIKNIPKNYINFQQNITFYYYIDGDNNEFYEEYLYENNKLKFYEADDIEDSTLEDYFMEHSDDVHSAQKIPIELCENYFDQEFSIFNTFTITTANERLHLGDFLKNMWKQNGNISVFEPYFHYMLNRYVLMDKFVKLSYDNEEESIHDIINKHIPKELNIDSEILFYSGRLNMEFGIDNSNKHSIQHKFSSIYEVGVFIKILFQLISLLDRSTPISITDILLLQNQNELRFSDISDGEKGEFEDTIVNIEDVIVSFQNSPNKISEYESIYEHFLSDIPSLLFGIKVKLFNLYMLEHFNEYFYNVSKPKLNFAKYYTELTNDFKKIIDPNTDKKDLESILIKWEEIKNIKIIASTILGNIIQLE